MVYDCEKPTLMFPLKMATLLFRWSSVLRGQHVTIQAAIKRMWRTYLLPKNVSLGGVACISMYIMYLCMIIWYVCVCMCVYICIYRYIHTHTHTHLGLLLDVSIGCGGLKGSEIGDTTLYKAKMEWTIVWILQVARTFPQPRCKWRWKMVRIGKHPTMIFIQLERIAA